MDGDELSRLQHFEYHRLMGGEDMRFYILGQLEVMSGDKPITIRAKRLRGMLAILLLNTTHIVHIDRIIDGLWSGEPPRSALENVRTYISQLRQLLADYDAQERLESHPGGYRILVGPHELDLLQFAAAATNGRQALQAGDPARAAVLLGEAIGLWRDTPLPELDLGPAIRAKAVALEEQRWQVQVDWINARLALGEHADLVPTLRELIGERPLDEGLWCNLITALHLTGRTGEALSAFAEARDILVDELGVEPGPELRRAQAAVLRGEELPRVSPRRITSALQRVIAPHQLPALGAGFVGRQDELRQVQALVRNMSVAEPAEQTPAVLVSGLPGVGKSAMALAAATSVRAAFPDGQLYVDLHGSTGSRPDADDLIVRLLAGLGVAPEAVPDTLDGRKALYRSLLADRRTLVVIDNAIDADQVTPLLPGPGPSLAIVTSRRRLVEVDGMHLSLEPLNDTAALHVLGGLIGHQRVGDESVAARTIVAACGKLPGAIRIAGARLAARPRHSMGILADRVSVTHRLLDELSTSELSLRKLFEVSYQRLDPRARECFRLLGRFEANRLTAAGLARLLRVPVAVADQELERLVHEGLVIPGATHNGEPEYQMPSALHAYARELLTAEGPQLARPRRDQDDGPGGAAIAQIRDWGCQTSVERHGRRRAADETTRNLEAMPKAAP